MLYLCIAVAVIIPYLICSINPAIMVTKIKSGKDIRELGSGNPGLTNTLRTQGKSAAAIVLLFDVSKGVGSVFAVKLFCTYVCELCSADIFMLVASLMAVIGHCFPLYYKFKGGKAILVTVSSLFVIDPLVALILLGVFIIIVAITRYVSLGSVISAALYPIAAWIRQGSLVWTAFAAITAAILIIKHRENIKRLLKGNEKKLARRHGRGGG
jgi:glycerol-3-phosphate acyltransferase PlsY